MEGKRLSGPIGRRDFLKGTAGIAVCAMAGSVLSACGGSQATPTTTETAGATATETTSATATKAAVSGSGETLNFYTWEVKYDQELYGEFEQKFGVRINPIYFSENEWLFNKLKVTGSKDFDLLMGDGFFPSLYRKEGYLETLDMTKIPNVKNLYPDFQPDNLVGIHKDAEGVFGLTHSWGSFLMQWDKENVKSVSGWKDLWNPEYAGKIAMHRWALAGIATTAMMLGLGGDDPYTLTDDELEQVKNKALELKPRIRMFWDNEADSLNLYLNQEAIIGMSYPSTVLQSNDGFKREKFGMFVPPEGVVGWIDGVAIGKGSKNVEAGHAFINWFLEADTQMRLMHKAKQTSCNKAARDLMVQNGEEKLVKELRLDDMEAYRKVRIFKPLSDEVAAKWTEIWNEVMAA